MKRTIKNLLQPGSLSIVDEKSAIDIVQKWHELYCPDNLKWAKKKPSKGFRWENITFSFEGEKAQEEYNSHVARSFYIMAEEFGVKNHILYESEIKPEINAFDEIFDFMYFQRILLGQWHLLMRVVDLALISQSKENTRVYKKETLSLLMQNFSISS